MRLLAFVVVGGVWEGVAHGQGSNGLFTAQVGSPAPPPVTLVNHTNTWFFRRGLTAPQADWLTALDSGLNSSWTNAPGGFGFGDPGIVGENTPINGLLNLGTTLFIRRTFTVGAQPDPLALVQLVVDYDDGFVAYLDGQEIARANLTNGPGAFVAHTATTGAVSHEGSCCNAPLHPAETFNCGTVSNRLAPGPHVLAFIVVNQAVNSSDLHLIPDLLLASGQTGPVEGTFLSLVKTNQVQLTGTNTVPGSTRVVINGDEADFNPAQGTWSRLQTLQPGVNSLAIQALDATGHILAGTNRLVVAELSAVSAGGTLATNTVWNSGMGIIHVTNTAALPAGGNLSIAAGTVVLLSPGAGLRANSAILSATGTANAPVWFLPADGSSVWGGLTASGVGGELRLQHIETIAGRAELLDGAAGTIEDSSFHDYTVSDPAILHTLGSPNPVTLNLRRCYIGRYHEVLCQISTNHIEGCLLEYQDYSGDGIDFDAGRPGSFVRRCTLRHGDIFNTDALDLGEYGGTGEPTRGVLIDSCLLRNFIDKGVSMGVGIEATVTNCLIYQVDTGVAVKDRSLAAIFNTTITEANCGFRGYNKADPGASSGGGFITNTFNNILWNLTNMAISLLNGSTLTADHTDLGLTNWAGEGNFSADPLFVAPGRHDYRLAANSPCLGVGRNGANLGVTLPVGGIPAIPWNLAALTLGSNGITLTWQEDSDNEEAFEVQRSSDQATWQTLGTVASDVTNLSDPSAVLDQPYYYRVRATNTVGVSGWSGLAGTRLRSPLTLAGGLLTSNTVWSDTVVVYSNVTVPVGLTLTVLPGTRVQLTNGVSISAQAGGTILVQGIFTNRVAFRPLATNGTWGTLSASGNNSALTLRHAELDHGSINLGSQATGVLEDCYVHDVFSAIVANGAGSATVRRCRVSHYSETIYNSTPVVVEDCLLENMTAPDSDALEIQGATASFGCVVRRCEVRSSTGGNSDALDFNGSSGVLLEDCVIHDFTDKGVSLGASGAGGVADFGITIRNCLIYGVDTGVAVKDGSTVSLTQSTIAGSAYGLRLYQKYTTPADGGHVTNGYNNILWDNATTVSLLNNSSLLLDWSDLAGTNWTGTSNLSADPLFLNAAQHDYRLASDSPCLRTGRGGLDRGVIFPVGLYILAPANLAILAGADTLTIHWQDNSPSESVYELERSTDGGPFAVLLSLPANVTSYTDTTVTPGSSYRYRVRGRSLVAVSDYSNEAVASLCSRPVFTLEPRSQVVLPGSRVTFAVSAIGCAPLGYAWHWNGALLPAQTNATLVLSNVTEAAGGDYVAVVTDPAGVVTSSVPARLTVVAAPRLQPVGGTSPSGLFSLRGTVPADLSAVVLASSNLWDWIPLITNRTSNTPFEVSDPASTQLPWRFYRLRLEP